jgi:Planctomycete cytochrome C
MRVALVCVLCLAGVAAGCVSDIEPEIGPLRAGVCKPEDSDPDHDVSFKQQIQLDLFARAPGQAGCGCHMSGSRRTGGIDATGLVLDSYATLMRGGTNSHDTIVVPGNPCASLVVQKVSSAPPSGARMPSDGPPYLSPPEIDLLSDWITEGAHDN